VATALIRPLAWEPPYAMGAAQEIAKKKKKKKERKENRMEQNGRRKLNSGQKSRRM